jgi:hypothetical protein
LSPSKEGLEVSGGANMRSLYDGKKFFSFHEHLNAKQAQELMDQAGLVMQKMEEQHGKQSICYHVAMLINPNRAENYEVVMNNIIGIA